MKPSGSASTVFVYSRWDFDAVVKKRPYILEQLWQNCYDALTCCKLSIYSMRIKVIILPAKIDCHIVLSGCKRSRMLKLLIGDFRRYKIEGIVQEILSFRFEPSFSHFRIHFSLCVYRFIYFYLPALIYHGCHIQPLSQFCRLSSALQISACYLPRQVKLMW